MPLELLNELLKVFADNESKAFHFFAVEDKIKTNNSVSLTDPSALMIGIQQLLKDGYLAQVDFEQLVQTSTLEKAYQITYEGKQLWLDGGYQIHLDRVEDQKKMQQEKLQAELSFVKRSKSMIPVTIGVSIITLLFIILSYINSRDDKQTKALNEIKIELQKLKVAIKPDSTIR